MRATLPLPLKPVLVPSCTWNCPPLFSQVALPLSWGIYYELYANLCSSLSPPLGQKLMKVRLGSSFSPNLRPFASDLAQAKCPVTALCA